jgi:hypothetical protein
LPEGRQPRPPAEEDPDTVEQEAVRWAPRAAAEDAASTESAEEAEDGTTASGEPAGARPDEPSSR